MTGKAVVSLCMIFLTNGSGAPRRTGFRNSGRLRRVPAVGWSGAALSPSRRSPARLPNLLQRAKLDHAGLAANAELGGTVPMWSWIGDDGATRFSY